MDTINTIHKNIIIPGNIYRMKGRGKTWMDKHCKEMESAWRIYDREGFRKEAIHHIEHFNIKSKRYDELIDDIYDKYGWRDNVLYALPAEFLDSWSFMVYNQYGESIPSGGYTNSDNLWNLVTGPEF